jgi:hypothetical protein
MRLYGEANDVQGLATGPIETRFARLRENTAADTLIVWTTPGRWATGEGLSLRFPQLHLEFTCSLGEGHLVATKVAQVLDDARPPDREPGAVGVVVQAERIPLPPEDVDSRPTSVSIPRKHFALAGKRWVNCRPLSAALEAEAREDEAPQRLTVPFKDAAHGGEETSGGSKRHRRSLRALDDGEWPRSSTTRRVRAARASSIRIRVRARSWWRAHRVRSHVRLRAAAVAGKILEQKRALLEELASPAAACRTWCAWSPRPRRCPSPKRRRCASSTGIVRNRSQSRAVALALGGRPKRCSFRARLAGKSTAAEIDVQLILRDRACGAGLSPPTTAPTTC